MRVSKIFLQDLIHWAHAEVDAIRSFKNLEPVNWQERVMSRYLCVMCLSDGNRTEATKMVEGKGYCADCAESLQRTGHTVSDLVPEKIPRSNALKLSEEQRKEIIELVASNESVTSIAQRYNVSDAYVYLLWRNAGVCRPRRVSKLRQAEQRIKTQQAKTAVPMTPKVELLKTEAVVVNPEMFKFTPTDKAFNDVLAYLERKKLALSQQLADIDAAVLTLTKVSQGLGDV